MPDETRQKIENLVDGTLAALPNIAIAIVVFAVFLLLGILVRRSIMHFNTRAGRAYNLGLVLSRVAQWFVALGGLLVALTVVLPSFRPGDLIQILGISSVAIGFAFRDILQNFLAGILILLTQPFRIDDQIVIGEYEGTVEEIQTRATFIRTYDGRRVVIPNATLFTGSVMVNTAFDARRLQYDIGIGYGDDVEAARGLMLDAMRSIEGVLDDPAPDVLVYELGGSSVNLRARWWIRPPRRADELEQRDRVITAIKRALVTNGIDLPYPTQQILFHDQTEETDGDRSRQREGWPAGNGDVPRPRSIAGSLRQLRDARTDASAAAGEK